MNIAVITGASSGLGAEFAKTIINNREQIDEIWLIARRKERLEEFAKEYNQVLMRPISLDLSSNSSYNKLNDLLEKENANIKLLINNAGFEKSGDFRSMNTTDILSMVDLNIKGFTMINRVCIPYMEKGSIGIMTCSISSFCPVPHQAVYSASKAYVRYLSRAIREEYKDEGIHILALCPGNMDTEMNPKGGNSQSAKVDKLPFLDMEIITRRSLVLAKKGRAIYTPGAFYKMYRFVSKLLPSSWMLKIVSRAY